MAAGGLAERLGLAARLCVLGIMHLAYFAYKVVVTGSEDRGIIVLAPQSLFSSGACQVFSSLPFCYSIPHTCPRWNPRAGTPQHHIREAGEYWLSQDGEAILQPVKGARKLHNLYLLTPRVSDCQCLSC